MKIDSFIHFLNHIEEYAKLSDNEIIAKASLNGGIDAEEALTNFLERDLCKEMIKNILLKVENGKERG